MDESENKLKSIKLKNKPWLKRNGRRKSVEEIRQICSRWTPTIWEEYLTSLESEQTEELLESPTDIEDYAEDFAGYMFSGEKEYPHLQQAFEVASEILAPREFEVLQMAYGENQSEVEIVRDLKLSRATVRMHTKRGLKKIRKLFKDGKIQRNLQFRKKMNLPVSPFGRLFSPIYRGKCQPDDSHPNPDGQCEGSIEIKTSL